MDNRGNTTGPIERESSMTEAMVENVQYTGGLTRYDCIYIYTGEWHVYTWSCVLDTLCTSI